MSRPSTTPTLLPPFLVLWTGQALSLIGSRAVQFSLIWWVTVRSGSATILSIAALLALVPHVVFGPFLGALVDRWNRKRIMLAADAAVAVASLALALLFASGRATIPHVLTLLFVRAIGGAIHGPAMAATTTLMVPARHLTRIQGLNQSLQGGQLVVSAPLGALLFGLLPMAGVMLVDVATALFAIVPLLFIHVPQPEGRADGSANLASTWRDVRDAFGYLRARGGHFVLLAMAAVINLCMVPAFTLLPLLVSQRLGGALQLGLMNSLFGAGTIAGGVLLGLWGGFKPRIYTTLVALIGSGVATLALGSAARLEPALAAIAALGLTIALVNGPILAVLQATVAPEFQGRVLSLYASLCAMMTPLGLAVAAPVADAFGVGVWFVAGGVACLTLGAGGFLIPALVRIERVDSSDAPTVAADRTVAEGA